MAEAPQTEQVRSLRVGRGEPLVLIHPFTANARVWRGVAAELADRFDILMVTLPGHFGGDCAPFGQISVPCLADYVEDAMDEVGWRTAHIAGNSLGGWLALELGARDRARSVTAFAPAGGWNGRFDFRRTLPLAAKFLAIAPLAMLGKVVYPYCKDLPLTHRAMLAIVSGDWRKVELEDVHSMLEASTHCAGYLAVLANGLLHGGMTTIADVHAPVRLVLCERDLIIPPAKYADLFQTGLRHVDTITLPGIGHVPMLEAPELCAQLIAEHAEASAVPLAV